MMPAELVETDRDSELVLLIFRLRRIVRAQSARCKAAFTTLVVLNDEVHQAGGAAYCLDTTGTAVAAFHSGTPGEAISHGAVKRAEVPETADREIGRKCEAAIQLWRRRALRYSALQQNLQRAVCELAYGKEPDA